MNASIASRPDPIAQFFLSPFHARSYTNLLYLVLTLPLGTVYFVFLATGLSIGTGLAITVLGLPLVGFTMLASWWLAALERKIAIGLLGAEVPPMGPTPFQSGNGFRYDLQEFLSNRVTWTGMLYLGLKFPLGIFSFVLVTTLIAVSTSFLLVPFLYPFNLIEWDGVLLWWVDTPAEAALCFVAGLLFTYASLLLLNGLAAFWKLLSVWMLGSERYAAAPAPPAPALMEPEAPAGAGAAGEP
jgi:hypothetical protein